MRNSAKYLLATAGIYLLTAGHPAADSIPFGFWIQTSKSPRC